MLFVHYPKCSTCKKAAKWLIDNGLRFEQRNIVTEKPNVVELKEWIGKSEMGISRFFNTSGIKYRELNLKDVVKNANQEELLILLASDGKLVKRPVLIAGDVVLVGFNEALWREKLIDNQ